MSEDDPQAFDELAEVPAPARRRRLRVLVGLLIVLALALAGTWLARERIANRIVAGQLEELGLPATYEIEKIGTNRQILTNVVVGDPARPDFTAERVEVETRLTLGTPTIGEVMLVRPRLYGQVMDGKVSFGALDKVIYTNRAGPKGLPDLDLKLVDGRARIESEWGVLGVKAEGRGNLRNSFVGTLAAVAPKLELGGCRMQGLSAYGKVTSSAAAPTFVGPVRLAALDCPAGPSLRKANLALVAKIGPLFDKVAGSYAIDSQRAAFQGSQLATVQGKGEYSYGAGQLVASYALNGTRLQAAGVQMARVKLDGDLHGRDGLTSWDASGALNGQGVTPGRGFDGALANMAGAGQGTLLEPLAKQLRAALLREAPGSSLSATYQLRQSGTITNLVVPGALWRGTGGARLAQLSRVTLVLGQRGGPRIAGNIITEGAGLPRIEGRFEQRGSGAGVAQLSLAEYRAGDSRVALPLLKVVQLPGGAIGFAGEARVSGPLPGGRIDNLRLPVEGNWSSRAGLAMLRTCTPVAFDRFKVANLSLNAQAMTICPGKEGAIVKFDGRGFRASAGASALSFTGTLGTTAIRLRSGAIGMAWPGALAARSIDVSLGPIDRPNTMQIADLRAQLGKVVTGTFAGTALKLDAVPLDMYDGAGNWRFAGGDLAVTGASLWVKDREKVARFYPLLARDAALQLHSTTFTAQALLREAKTDRVIVDTRISHDLDTALGHAELLVPGITFDKQLQPEMLTYYTQGVVADVFGTVTGRGDIDWNRDGVTSTGDFNTRNADFAALFGPVKGVSGTVHFSDLLKLETPPRQHLTVKSINPGIEVNDGDVWFQLAPDKVLLVEGGEWPFIDGTMKLLPTRMVIGSSEVRRFTLMVEGINSAKFVQRLELANISATGIFDGSLPLVFDENGGRIEGGLLVSRPPGGNISYVGELTYKDLSPMGNFAFDALKSLDFSRMEITLQGNIDGEIVTQMHIDGVKQGKGAKRNFLTRRFEGLPVVFNINIRAPFYQLIGSFKSLYDPSRIRDPRELGLVGKQAKPAAPAPVIPPQPVPSPPAALPPAVQPTQKPDDIQAPDSRNSP
ncbi:YdbH domain-containing protein [Novosphingobium sp.]|uniref:YdbH domain-containing protein n=1 Tax=Novosphingobium sp. TaxID=1874826 RepID=UPI00286BCBE1|nr:YdbH domain-containing protein [Novosphingobium sp.]